MKTKCETCKTKGVAAKEDGTWSGVLVFFPRPRADLTLILFYIQCRSSSRLELAYTVAQDFRKIS